MSVDTSSRPPGERRELKDRRVDAGRRSVPERRHSERRASIIMVALHRRVGGERRGKRTRRGGTERRVVADRRRGHAASDSLS